MAKLIKHQRLLIEMCSSKEALGDFLKFYVYVWIDFSLYVELVESIPEKVLINSIP